MVVSELTVYDFLREKINLSENDARRYAKELSSAEEKLYTETKLSIAEQINRGDYSTKKDIKDLEIKITQLEVKIEKGFKEVIVWIVGAMIAIGGLTIAVIKLF